jgi:hypothetical protein
MTDSRSGARRTVLWLEGTPEPGVKQGKSGGRARNAGGMAAGERPLARVGGMDRIDSVDWIDPVAAVTS